MIVTAASSGGKGRAAENSGQITSCLQHTCSWHALVGCFLKGVVVQVLKTVACLLHQSELAA